jgi:uncharacterized protein YyaL (SSP411 family)
MPNHLAKETSPYLLQHAHNPVDWFPWSDEALQIAREQDKPILLSIGYSSCHWCHVMERESFEDKATAEIMNRYFVNIKVDREERPDLDAIYMNYVQMATGQGGWPLTVFLTPDLIPFFGGTYFPPHSAHGRPGFRVVLENTRNFFHSQRQEIDNKKQDILKALNRTVSVDFGQSELSLETAFLNLSRQFDSRYGGFGNAPKFPNTMTLAFLLRWFERTDDPSTLEPVKLSLDSMARGGIYDHLGGGFHRYSVDDRWLVPHFEKMLYDNALLARLYLEAFQVTGMDFYSRVAEETLSYVQRDMTDSGGGFYSAEDADSEGEEGRFYVWSPEETEAILGSEDARLFNDFYDVTRSGNWEGKNILNHRRDLSGLAQELSISAEELLRRLDSCRARLFEAREKRERPLLDDKVLASWNGLMLTAFAEAAVVLNSKEFLSTAQRNAEFITERMVIDGRIHRSWKNGTAKQIGYLDDYAHVIEGLVALYEVEGDTVWLYQALKLMDTQIDLFYDSAQGEFFFTSKEHEALPVRHKEFFDNAIPSGNSVSCLNLLRLAVLTGNETYRAIATRMLQKMSGGMTQYPLGFGNWLRAADFHQGPIKEIILIGSGTGREPFLEQVRKSFLPRKVIVQTEQVTPQLEEKLPLLAHRTTLDGRATGYLCEDYSCKEPTTDAKVFGRLLREKR